MCVRNEFGESLDFDGFRPKKNLNVFDAIYSTIRNFMHDWFWLTVLDVLFNHQFNY